jgi:tRNA (guanine37-N1)-methyltransferase
MQFHIFSLFPDVIEPYVSSSILGRAVSGGLISVTTHNIRDWAHDKHQTADDIPYGGGPGMVLKVGPIYEGVTTIREGLKGKNVRTVLFSTRGTVFNEQEAQRLAQYDTLIMICGRYEGVDERIAQHVADEELSIGDFVLSGGELPAMIVTDAVARKITGVLGKEESLEEIKGSYPVYTRPETFYPEGENGEGWSVPEVLKSGNHKEIEKWRKEHK